jgi:hypothetical protein
MPSSGISLSGIKPCGNRSWHASVFALVAIPLLTYPGSKLSDKIRVAPLLASPQFRILELALSKLPWDN